MAAKLKEVVEHCANIGLRPTIITHGQNCDERKIRTLEDAGLNDWLISLHGLGDAHDKAVVDRKGNGEGGFERLTTNLGLMQRPTRFNTTLQVHNYKILPEMAKWLAQERAPTVWNLIQFNPFRAWDGLDTIDFQVKMTDMAPYIGKAVETAEAAGFEVNVRYFSFCVAAEHGFEKNCINYYQTQFDPHEWALEASNRLHIDEVRKLGGAKRTRQMYCDAIREQRMNPKCGDCRFNAICEGPTPQYQRRFGTEELRPVAGPVIDDAIWFEHDGNSWPRQAS